MKRGFLSILAVAAVAAMAPGTALASHNTAQHSPNMSLVANFSMEGAYGLGSDLAFWGNMVVAGSYAPGGFRLLDISNPTAPSQIGFFECAGTQADVSIWKDLAFVSVDAPRAPGNDPSMQPREAHECGAPAANAAQFQAGTFWEGVRIVSIADRTRPVQIAAVKTECGSHTHTIYPDEANGRILIYVLSYPLNPQGPSCNPQTHRKISVIEVPLSNPAAAKVIGTPSTGQAIGCHDMTVFMDRKIAGAACITESQMWDLSNPANPTILATIRNPMINIHHSTNFTWDGNVMTLGDELGGAAASPGCPGREDLQPGGLFFYDVKDPRAPVLKGTYKIPAGQASLLCTAHLFNTVPLRSDKDILVSSWYTGATSVIDYTDPARAKQVAFYIPNERSTPQAERSEAAAWSSYWYNGYVYSNNYHSANSPTDATNPGVRRGFDVFGVTLPELADEIRLDRLNPQLQESFQAATGGRVSSGGGGGGGAAGRGTPTSGPSRLLISRRTVRLTRAGVLRLGVYCRGGRTCDGVLTVRLARQFRRGEPGVRPTFLGRRSFGVPARRRTVLTLRLPASKRRLITRLGGAHAVATAVMRNLGDQRRRTTAKFYVKRPAQFKGRR